MKDIHDIRPPVPAGFDYMIFWIFLAIVLGIIILGLATVFFIKRWKNKKGLRPQDIAPVQKPAYETAIASLKALQAVKGIDARLFYFELTLVLRRYLDNSFNCRTCEMTSQEFVKALSSVDLDKNIRQKVVQFVNLCDPIKYGGNAPDFDQVNTDINNVRSLLEQIETRLVKAGRADPEGA